MDVSGLAANRLANPVARIFKKPANDSPSPWGEGRDEGGREPFEIRIPHLESEISNVNAQWEAAIRKPPRPEMRDKTEGISASEGLFGAKWLMPMEYVLQIAPQPVPFFQIKSDNFCHFGKYNGQQASFSYYFENNQLTEIWVCVNKSSEKKFRRMQLHLSTGFGPMSAPCPSKDYKLLSKGDFNQLVIEHWLNDDEQVGLTEMIKFRTTAKPS